MTEFESIIKSLDSIYLKFGRFMTPDEVYGLARSKYAMNLLNSYLTEHANALLRYNDGICNVIIPEKCEHCEWMYKTKCRCPAGCIKEKSTGTSTANITVTVEKSDDEK